MNEREIDKIVEDLLDETMAMNKDAVMEGMKPVYREAVIFKQVILECAREMQDFKDLLKRQKELRTKYGGEKKVITPDKGSIYDEYQTGLEKQRLFLHGNVPERIYSEVFKFQNILNEALNQKVETVVVFEDKNGEPALFTMQNKDILSYDTNRGNLMARYKPTKEAIDNSLQRMALMDDMIPREKDNINETYMKALGRFKNSKLKPKQVMWLNPSPPPKWKAMKVSAAGDIAEAYAAVILQRQEKYFNNDLETNIDLFMTKYVADVDSASGMLQGDVAVGNMEYAIKSADAGVLGVKQFEKIADEILKGGFDLNKLMAKKEEFRKKGRLRNKLVDVIDSIADETYKEFIESNLT